MTFIQWLYNHYKIDTVREDTDALDLLEFEIQYEKKHPGEGDLEGLEKKKGALESEIHDLYEQYTRDTEAPESYEDALFGAWVSVERAGAQIFYR